MSKIKSYDDFWNWFQKNEKRFFDVVKQHESVEKNFFNKIAPKLQELKDGFFYLAGMYDDNTAELVVTADGTIRNIVFVEELIGAAPDIAGWKFTALKESSDIENVSIEMDGLTFNAQNISFYSITIPGRPDEIDITVVYDDLIDDNQALATNGVYIFLDNYIGELNFATTVDNLTVISKSVAAKEELVAIGKLKDFLIWRQKEFVEKYEGVRYDTDNDTYSNLTAELESGNNLVAIVNSTLLEWDSKASHPWILVIEINYDGENTNGMPDEAAYTLLNKIEDEIMSQLVDSEGYLSIGRETANGTRTIYFACKDFRLPSKVAYRIQGAYVDEIRFSYDIYKDKYWQSFDKFLSSI